MSKFKKILVLTLMLALMLTAFVVASLAAEEPKAVNVGGHKTDTTFESFAVGSSPFTKQNTGANGGIYVSEAYPGGNKYLEIVGTTGATSNLHYSTFISDDYTRRTTYTLGKYPIVAFDLDIMSPDGNWGGYVEKGTINQNNSAGFYFRPYLGSSMQGTIFADVTFASLGLSTEPGIWYHITVVFRLSYSNYGESLINQYVYVNGELAKTYTTLNMTEKYPTTDASKLFIGPVYFRSSRYGDTASGNHQALDNMQFTYFEPGYDFSKVPNYIYKDTYKMPYGVTVARIGDGYYDSITKAMESAKSGDVIRLVSDIDKVVDVNKTVIFDINKYDELGNPTGEYYTFKPSSTTLVSTSENGFVTFKQVQNASVQIYWDDCPGAAMGGKCTCPSKYLDENGKHIMEAFTSNAMLNSTPLYPGEIPEFPLVGTIEKRFVGWSLEQGGKPVELTPITSEQISDGWISLYPVYEEYVYAIEVIAPDGTSTLYAEENVKTAFSKAPANSTIKLHADVRVPMIDLAVKNLTLDLNGYSYLNLTTQEIEHYTEYDEETGEVVEKTKTVVTSTDGKGNLFSDPNSKEFTFTIKSSRPGALMASLTVTRDGDKVTKVVGRRLVTTQNSMMTLNIFGDGITFYSDEIFHATYKLSSVHLLVDGGTYCYVPEESKDVCGLFTIKSGNTHYIKNATIYANGDYIFRNNTNDRDFKTKYIYQNCNIYSAKIATNYTGDTHVFENCRLDFSSIQGTIVMGGGNLLTKSIFEAHNPVNGTKTFKFSYSGDGVGAEAISESYDFYTPVADYTSIINPVTLLPVILPGANYKQVPFAYKTVDSSLAYTTVTFLDLNGNVISTVEALQNQSVATPVVAVDGYRALANPVWVNVADQTVLGETLGSESSYVFKATLPAEPVYEANLSVAMMNMAYYNGFAYNIFLPKTDDAEFISVSAGAILNGTVFINGQEYYVYTVSVDATKALDDLTVEVKYSVGGAEYTEQFVIDALVYANASLESAEHSAEDKMVSKSLIKYLDTLYRYVSGSDSLSGNVYLKLHSFYAKYPAIDFISDYSEEELCDFDAEAIDAYVDSIYFRISSGSRIGLAVALSDEAVARKYTLKINGENFDTVSGTRYFTDFAPVYATLMDPVCEISVVNAAGEVLATTSYSMATYIMTMEAAGQNVDVVKALYTFGRAVLDVRNAAFG